MSNGRVYVGVSLLQLLINEGHCMKCPIPPAQAGSKAVLPDEGSGRLPKSCEWSCGDLGFPSIRTV